MTEIILALKDGLIWQDRKIVLLQAFHVELFVQLVCFLQMKMFLWTCRYSRWNLSCIRCFLLSAWQNDLTSMSVWLFIVDLSVYGVDWSTIRFGATWQSYSIQYVVQIWIWLCWNLLILQVFLIIQILRILRCVNCCLEYANLRSQICQLLLIFLLLLSNLNFLLRHRLCHSVNFLLEFFNSLVLDVHELSQSEFVFLELFQLSLMTSF